MTNTESLPKLVGTHFVKMLREFLLDEIEKTGTITIKELIKTTYMEKNVKPETVKRYIQELIDLEIVEENDGILTYPN